MKLVVFISHSAQLTGAPLLLWEIARRLDRSRFTPHFLLPEDGPLVAKFLAIGDTTIEPLYPDELRYWREVKRVGRRLKFLRDRSPALVYANTIHPAKWLVYAKMLGIPTITHVHELSMGFATLNAQEHWMVRNCSTRFIAVSDAVRNHLVYSQRVDPSRVDVVRAGIDVQRFSSRIDASSLRKELGLEGAFVVGTVGRVTPMKGSDILLRLARGVAECPQSGKPITFLVVATTDDSEAFTKFMSDREQLKLEKSVIVVKNVPDVLPYYGLMDAYVSTAREDPFPLVIMEAMASGKPIIAFAVGGIPEALGSGCGILVENMDIARMQRELLDLASNPDRCRSLGQSARERVAKEFDISRNVHLIESVIDKVAGG